MRIEELNDVPLRVIYDDQGRITDIIDNRGVSQGFVLSKVDTLIPRPLKQWAHLITCSLLLSAASYRNT